ncbi:MAG: HAMP domain-containing sensor histidine kinase [Hyphomicrobiaceae bacterium]
MPLKSGPDFTRAPAAPGLAWITHLHLLLAAGISVLLLSVLCFIENFHDEAYFTRWFLLVEASRIHAILQKDEQTKALALATSLAPYKGEHADSYAFRIWTTDRGLLASSNSALIDATSPIDLTRRTWPDRWQHKASDVWFDTVGGFKFSGNSAPIWIEVATRGDPAGRRYTALAHDFFFDVLRPTVPTLLFGALLAMLSLRRMVRRLQESADAAMALRPGEGNLRIPTAGLPREFGVLANAVNDLLARLSNVIQRQNEFIGRAAHQLRLPLAVMMLDAGKSSEEGTKRLEGNVASMSNMIDRLLELSRLQSIQALPRDALDLGDIAEDVKIELRPLAEERGARVEVVHDEAVPVEGNFTALREAVLNLATNAIIHGSGQSVVRITCGPGAAMSVEDNGPGIKGIAREDLFEPFSRGRTTASGSGLGLAIVKQVVQLHEGSIEVDRSPDLGGARFTLQLAGREQCSPV